MKKIIFWGDEVFTGSHGFAEILIDYIFLSHPLNQIQTYSYGGEGATWQQVLAQTPLHVISKSPDQILLCLGYNEIQSGKNVEYISIEVHNLLHLILEKTKAEIFVGNLCVDLFAEDKQEQAKQFNQILANINLPRLRLVDLDIPFKNYLQKHRESTGEKRSLHTQWNKLTTLGKLLLAQHFFQHLLEHSSYKA